MFRCWLDDVRKWENSDFSKLSRVWVCITGVPHFFWHSDFFSKLGMELGKLIKILPRTLKKKGLREVWIKIYVVNLTEIPASVVMMYD